MNSHSDTTFDDKTFNRRHFLFRAGTVAGGAALASQMLPLAQLPAAENGPSANGVSEPELGPIATSTGLTRPFAPAGVKLPYHPVITPNNATLPWKWVEGVKVFHLIAEPVVHEFAPGLVANCWGYNSRVHGPTIEAVDGDRIRI